MDYSQQLTNSNELRQTQEQILAPQQLVSLEILTAPLMELEQRINHELETNPALELDEDEPDEQKHDEEHDEHLHPATQSATESKLTPADQDAVTHSDPHAEMLDSNRQDYDEHLDQLAASDSPYDYEDFSGDRSDASGTDREREEKLKQYIIDSVQEKPSLQEQLLEQLRLAEKTDAVAHAAEYIIGSIDDSGYLQTSLAEVAQALPSDMKTVETALKLVQSFEPPGIGARDERECLLLQLERSGRRNSLLAELVDKYLDEVARNKLPYVAKKMNISLEELNELIGGIRKLNPHPGAAVAPDNPIFITPEAFVEPDGDEFKVIMNDSAMPKLRFSKYCRELLGNPSVADGDKAYIRSKINSGKNLIRSLEQRQSTIKRIAELIVSNQYDFLRNGPEYLKPMTMQQLADMLDLHETTISRAIAGKYIQTPMGLFRFKYFFTGGFQSEAGEEVSSHGIKEIIRDFVANEDRSSPLSDNEMTKMLKERGFDVARRTIAKYREELGIQSSQLRRVFKS